MKRKNLIYLALIPLLYVLFMFGGGGQEDQALFFGFAENKDTNISHYEDVKVEEIMVAPGQQVKAGQPLMKVSQGSLNQKIQGLNMDIDKLASEAMINRNKIKSEINELEIKKEAEVQKIKGNIQQVEAEIATYRSMREGLNTIPNNNTIPEKLSTELQIEKNALAVTINSYDALINEARHMLNSINQPLSNQTNKFKNQVEYYNAEVDKLSIVAPHDGIIGNILCKVGENVSAFNTMINFYEKTPTVVKGYIHESDILRVKNNDTLKIVSILHPELNVTGQVSGLGTRIVEIPERLRKMPDIKTYGREVIISIPANNPFLQKEKVMLNGFNEGQDTSFLSRLLSLRIRKQNMR